jgi:hypothetical protein
MREAKGQPRCLLPLIAVVLSMRRPYNVASPSYDEILRTKVAFSTGPTLIDQLRQLKDELALTGIAAELDPGGLLPFGQEMRSLKILTQQVMPAFK